MTQGSGRWSLDKKKSGSSRLAPTSAGSLTDNGGFQPLPVWLKRLEELAAGVWTKKSESARVALKGIRRTSSVAVFATQLDWLMTQRAGRWSLDIEEKRKCPCSSGGH
ncbi:hypothetical protein [Planococcus soli]|uniref:hypothetical protein n=1 Tax=Planococcus soli TaxID=2666072 RepID=UPI00115C65AC|nr:hypothetical protein [Planococcus soli]